MESNRRGGASGYRRQKQTLPTRLRPTARMALRNLKATRRTKEVMLRR